MGSVIARLIRRGLPWKSRPKAETFFPQSILTKMVLSRCVEVMSKSVVDLTLLEVLAVIFCTMPNCQVEELFDGLSVFPKIIQAISDSHVLFEDSPRHPQAPAYVGYPAIDCCPLMYFNNML